MNEKENLHWYAIHVRSRHEFKVHERIEKYNIEAFLPTVQRKSQWKDRKKLVKFPIFPGYLFTHIPTEPSILLTILKIPGVVRFIGQKGQDPEIVPDEQVMSLIKVVQNKKEIDPYPYLKQGQRIRIKNGALRGAEGLLVKKQEKHLLVISIDLLQQGVCVQIDASDVEPI